MVSSNEWSSGKDWTPINRDKALGLLNSNSPKERREALGRLADVGIFEDTPKMLASLWDSEYSVRKWQKMLYGDYGQEPTILI